MKIVRFLTFLGLWAAYWVVLVYLLIAPIWLAILVLPIAAVPALFTMRAILGRPARS